MGPFFKVSDDWQNCAHPIKFKPMKTNMFGSASDAANKKSKKKSGEFKAQEEQQQKEQTHKVQSGRIEKQKNNIKGQQKLKLKPALLKAIATSTDSKMVIDEESAPTASAAGTSNALAAKFKTELSGGRFRYINEQLYTMNSVKAEKLFQQDQEAFQAYHEGYRKQVEKWPMNPLQRIIKTISRLPKTLIIGDFGCGEGNLAQSLTNKVYSMDLVSVRDDIIACDMANTPLEAQTLDVVVYCLSLMGTNLNDFFLEANRVLKLHGQIFIAEIQSRFEDVREFVRAMEACGFKMLKKDVAVNYFYFFHFRKMRHVGKVVKLKPFSLKPCLYRKR